MAKGIVAFAFGRGGRLSSNRAIARLAARKAREFKAPIYTQADVPLPDDLDIELTPEIPGNPPPTLRIARGAIIWAGFRELDTLIVVAAKPHLWRCLRDLRHMAKEEKEMIRIVPCSKIGNFPWRVWFSEFSEQKRTTSFSRWWRRELVLRILPFSLYRRITS